MPLTIPKGGGIRRNNTAIYRHEDGSMRVRLHQTDIVIVRADSVTYDCGGWATMTTARRMNEVAVAWKLPPAPSCAELRRDSSVRVIKLPAA